MKTKSVSKLKLSKEVVVLLNDQQSNLIGGERKKSITWTDPTANTYCYVCDSPVVISKN